MAVFVLVCLNAWCPCCVCQEQQAHVCQLAELRAGLAASETECHRLSAQLEEVELTSSSRVVHLNQQVGGGACGGVIQSYGAPHPASWVDGG